MHHGPRLREVSLFPPYIRERKETAANLLSYSSRTPDIQLAQSPHTPEFRRPPPLSNHPPLKVIITTSSLAAPPAARSNQARRAQDSWLCQDRARCWGVLPDWVRALRAGCFRGGRSCRWDGWGGDWREAGDCVSVWWVG